MSLQATNKHYQEDKQREGMPQVHEDLIIITKLMQVRKNISVKTDVKKVVIPPMWRDLDVQPVDINPRTTTSLVILVACTTRRKSLNTRNSQNNPEHIN